MKFSNAGSLFKLLIASTVMLVVGCTAVKKTDPVPELSKPAEVPLPLQTALASVTGYKLGDLVNPDGSENGKCVNAGRFGATTTGPVTQIFCFANKNEKSKARRTKYWVSFTPPEHDHKVWRVEISVPEKKASEVSLVSELVRYYGPPRKTEKPFRLSWKYQDMHLTVKEDDYGTHFLLWDRTLR